MKRKIAILTLLLSVFIAGIVTASSINGDYKGMPIAKVLVNGKAVASEVPAYIDGAGTTMLPLRAISEALGASVSWDGSTYTVRVDSPLSQEALKKISQSIALIYVYDQNDKAISQGTGFIIEDAKQGKILITNCHVACKGPNLRVEVGSQVIAIRNESLFKNEQTDVFGVKISTTSPGIPYQQDIPSVGTNIWTLGYPNAQFKTNKGQVLNIGKDNGEDVIIHSAKTESGQSGGVLLSNDGNVIGITTSSNNDYTDNEAIQMKYVQQELDKLH